MESKFYSSIANYYEQIFPVTDTKVDFVLHNLPKQAQRILDIGCATGELTAKISANDLMLEGIDLDSTFIEMAKQKYASDQCNFSQMNMLDISRHYSQEQFDGVVCLGNTLVHLNDEHEIAQLFEAIHTVLRKGGAFVFQILNYDKILEEKPDTLPLISNKNMLFERYYDYSEERILFSTRLSSKDRDEPIINQQKLFPLRKGQLKKLLEEAGFSNIQFWGNLMMEPYQKNESFPLTGAAFK